MKEALAPSEQVSFSPKALTAVAGVVLLLSVPATLPRKEVTPEVRFKIPSEHSWERSISTEYFISEPILQESPVIPTELKDQPNYSYNEAIDFLKGLNLPTTFPI